MIEERQERKKQTFYFKKNGRLSELRNSITKDVKRVVVRIELNLIIASRSS